MPADFFIDVKQGVVFSRATGAFGRAEALDHMVRLLGHPDFSPEFNQLADFRGISEMTLSAADVEELSRRTVFSMHSRRAFVVSTDLQYGYSRMFGIFREIGGEPGITTFRDIGEALSWLSLAREPDSSLFAKPGPEGDPR
jgi:hypothetical protein